MNRLIAFRREYFLICADDFTTLKLAVDAYRTHPLSGGPDPLFEASICRHLIINRVDLVENLLKYWKQLDEHKILKAYFEKKVLNSERIKALISAFEKAGFSTDETIFNKYLALKHLRNYIVHGDLSPDVQTFISTQDFPTDFRSSSRP